jgi:hypothetical protein
MRSTTAFSTWTFSTARGRVAAGQAIRRFAQRVVLEGVYLGQNLSLVQQVFAIEQHDQGADLEHGGKSQLLMSYRLFRGTPVCHGKFLPYL